MIIEEETKKFKGARVLIVGMARTGISAARFFARAGSKITISESRAKAQMASALKELEDVYKDLKDFNIELEFGAHREETFDNKDWIIVSPGVPMYLPALIEARKKGTPVLSDIEIAFMVSNTPIIAITGTNGKTTTAELLADILKRAGRRVFLGGNIGTPVLDAFEQPDDYELFVLEVSSFQLEGTKRFAPHIAIILNLTPDHLDRYQDIDEYTKAKSRILSAQKKGDFAILNVRDPRVSSLMDQCNAQVYSFDSIGDISRGIDNRAGHLIIHDHDNQIDLGSLAQMGLKGIHNQENMMAASLAAYLTGAPASDIKEGLRQFKGLSHRLEMVRDINGVQFVNDSKGTNVGAVLCALESIRPPIIMIAGGQDKEGDFSLLAPMVRQKVKALYLIGEAAIKIADSLKDCTEIIHSVDLRAAVTDAYKMAKQGDTILLSPGCASFDMFKDYKDRGEQFKQLIMELS